MPQKGLIIGVYSDPCSDMSLTAGAEKYNGCTGGKLLELLRE